jgi:beta-lactamase regulating signal transducer with metallopeptidase domain
MGFAVRRAIVIAADPVVDLSPVMAALPFVVRAAAAVWIAGVAIAFVTLVVSWRRTRLWRRRDVKAADPVLTQLVNDVADRVGVKPSVTTLVSTRVMVPVVIGWRHPRLVLPAAAVASLATSELRVIVAHELAHVRRHDYFVNLLQAVAERLLFFHPAARWLSAAIRTEREYCCDDAAVRVGQDALAYAKTLAALDDARGDHGLVVAANAGTLLDRIERLSGRPRHVLTPTRGLLLMTLAGGLAAGLFALTMTVPPSLPPGSKLRRRTPAVSAPRSLSDLPPSGSANRSLNRG